ncbi:MAG: tetratricopeptide repeat protein [Ignavibacteria bacterium]|jgi:tetratricopeptide (TPR) repeat protein
MTVEIKKTLYILMCVFIINPLVINKMTAQDKNEITITIDSIPNNSMSVHFVNAEELRKEFKFEEAINEYQEMINSKENNDLTPEATYNIGLCYCGLNDLENAGFYFTKVINEYKTDPLVVSFSQYGLSWIKVKESKFDEAIEILENELNSKNCNDYEHNAVMLFKIGKIYQNCLQDYEKANEIYKQLIANYPDAKIIDHPILDYLRKN